jgi:cytochrome b6-f complex iron-sulfur subunit
MLRRKLGDMADEEMQEQAPAKAEKEKAPARLATEMSASGGHAVVVAPAPALPSAPSLPKVSRRKLVILGWWSAIAAMLALIVTGLLNFLWNRSPNSLSGVFTLDINANDIAEGEKRDVVVLVPNERNPLQALEAKVFIARLNETQAGLNPGGEGKAGAYLALSRKCPHLGCTVPYAEDFTFADPGNNGAVITGWFRCPCHGSTYSDSGRRVFGPAPRSMDLYGLTISPDGVMTVNLDLSITGAPDNAKYAINPGEETTV